MGKWLRLIHQFHFTNQDFGARRHAETGHLCNFEGRLTHDRRIQAAVFQDDILYGAQFSTLQHVAAMAGETFTHGVIN